MSEDGKYRSILTPSDRVNSLGIAMEVVIIIGGVGLVGFSIFVLWKLFT